MGILDRLFGRRRDKPMSRSSYSASTYSGSSGCPYKSAGRCVVNGKDTGPCSLQPGKYYESDCFVYRSEKYGPQELFRGL